MATRKKAQAGQTAPINEAKALAEALSPQGTSADKPAVEAEQPTVERVEQPTVDTEQPTAEASEAPTETATKAEAETAAKAKAETPAEKPKPTQKKPVQTVKLNRLMNIRKAPSLDAGIICTKSRDTVLTIIEGQKNGWLKVSVDGEEAYVLYENGKYGTISG